MTLAFPITSWVVCALCLLIAVVVGTYRHGCKYLWIRTAIVLVGRAGDNKPEELRLGAYAPGWKSIKVRIGQWLLVAAFTPWARLGGPSYCGVSISARAASTSLASCSPGGFCPPCLAEAWRTTPCEWSKVFRIEGKLAIPLGICGLMPAK